MSEHTSIRTSPEVLARASALATSLEGRMPMRMSRSVALRLALLVGLQQLELAAAGGDVAGALQALALAGKAAAR